MSDPKRSLLSEADDGPQHYSLRTANGLIRCDVVFGLTRAPRVPGEVRDAWKDFAARLRAFADAIEKVEAGAPSLVSGGDA